MFLVPKDQILIDLGPSLHGEYRTFYNTRTPLSDNLDRNVDQLDSKTKRSSYFLQENHRFPRIQRLWRLPSNYEVVKEFDMKYERLREADFAFCYNFSNEKGQEMIPNLRKNS